MSLDKEREELESLRIQNGGLLLVDPVIDFAMAHPDSSLHRHFNWDVDKAAREHWRSQARALIARVKIVVLTPEPQTVRCYQSLPDNRVDGGYTATVEILTDDRMRGQMLDDMLRRIAYWRQQAQVFGAPIIHALTALEAAATAARGNQAGRRATKQRKSQ